MARGAFFPAGGLKPPQESVLWLQYLNPGDLPVQTSKIRGFAASTNSVRKTGFAR